MSHHPRKVYVGDKVRILNPTCLEDLSGIPCQGKPGIVINEGHYEPTEHGYLAHVQFNKPIFCPLTEEKTHDCNLMDWELTVIDKRPLAERIASSEAKKHHKLYAASVLGRQSGIQGQLIPTPGGIRSKRKIKPMTTKYEIAGVEVTKSAYEDWIADQKMQEFVRSVEEEQRRKDEEYEARERAKTSKQHAAEKSRETRQRKYHILSDKEIEDVMFKRRRWAIIRDLETTSKITFKRIDVRQYLWKLHPDRYDLQGVDTKNALWWWKHLTAEQKAKLPEIVREHYLAVAAFIKKRTLEKGKPGKKMRRSSGEKAPEPLTQQKRNLRSHLHRIGFEITPELEDMLDNLDPSLTYKENEQGFMDFLNRPQERIGRATAAPHLKKTKRGKHKKKRDKTRKT